MKVPRTNRPKTRKAPIKHAPPASLQDKLDQLTRELGEASQRETATSEVLKVISSSPGELAPVFDAILVNATRICEAKIGVLYLRDGDDLRFVAATHDAPAAYFEARKQTGVSPDGPIRRAATTKQVAHVTDIREQQSYLDRHPSTVASVELGKFRTVLGVPMLKDDELIGVITLNRQEVRPFTDKQIELVQNFAAQAVIAIENTRLLNELRQRTDDLSESLEQQTASGEILASISGSMTDTKPVFDAIVRNLLRLFGSRWACVQVLHDGIVHMPAIDGEAGSKKLIDYYPRPLDESTMGGRAMLSKQILQFSEIENNPAVPLATQQFALEFGFRSAIFAPMIRDNRVIGAIGVANFKPKVFSDKQVALIKAFADQAVIAIENTRLLKELRQRTDDLTESLQQQTATADVLKVISSSPGELEPVFQAMLAKATELCEASYGAMWLCEGDAFRNAAIHGALPAAYIEQWRQKTLVRPGPDVTFARVVQTRKPIQVADLRESRGYLNGDPMAVTAVEVGGIRTLVSVPMFKAGDVIGAITIYRQEVRPFTDKQVELLTNFAAQAVIAIENARLLNELRESLQQQTATADVLKVISRSSGDLEPVFSAMLENATRICEAEFGNLFLREGDSFRGVGVHGQSDYAASFRREPVVRMKDHSDVPLFRVLKDKHVLHIPDLRQDESYLAGKHRIVSLVDTAGARTLLNVPMLKENEIVGVIGIYRQEVRPFTDKQIELVQNFAAQAVIAIENTRLLSELRESLQQQTATADVLKVISRSTFDLHAVLQTLVESAARLCDADKSIITREKNGILYRAEAYGFSREFIDHVRGTPIKAERGSAFGRALLEGRVIHIPDVKTDPEYTFIEHQKLGDFRTILAVPMLREGVPTGVVSLTRSEVRPFTDKQIELATTFADQAAIAIENVRLFESVEARTRELAKSLEDLRATQDRLVQTQKLASLGQLTAGIAHEIKNPLNFVNNFSIVSRELIDELQATLKGPIDEKIRAEVNELANTLRGNLDKVVQHGKRADAIVKNMLQHSREGSGEHRVVDINTLVEESLNLAYHGARAEKQGFEITLERSFDPGAGKADVFPQDITRVLLNLISNGFYAANKRRAETNGGDYEPTLTAATKNLGDRVEITIRDNGTGVPPDVKEKMFNPFFTTKPAGEGTGLGLSICHDIIVKQHAGSIEVDTQPGAFTKISVILPRAAALLPERS